MMYVCDVLSLNISELNESLAASPLQWVRFSTWRFVGGGLGFRV